MRDDYDKQDDRKLILGPILKYASIGIIIGVVFITGTVTLERHVNTFEQEIAELKENLANANTENTAAQNQPAASSAQTEAIAGKTYSAGNAAPQAAAVIEPPQVVSSIITREDEAVTGTVTSAEIPAASPAIVETPEPEAQNSEIADSLAMPAQNQAMNTRTAPAVTDRSQADPEPVAPASADSIEQPYTNDSAEQAESIDYATDDTALVTESKSIQQQQAERLSHREWVEQQRLRHELWLQEIEQRRNDDFNTRKATQPAFQVNVVPSKQESI